MWRCVDWIGFGAELLGGKLTIDQWNELTDSLAAFTEKRTKAELLAEALARRLLIAPVSTPQDVMETAHFTDRGYWETAELGGRPVRTPGPFAKLSATPIKPFGTAPRPGEHNGTIAPRPPATSSGTGQRQLPIAR